MITKMIILFFLFNLLPLSAENLPSPQTCALKKEYLKELTVFKNGIMKLLKDKKYLMIMDSLTIGEDIDGNRRYSFSSNINSIMLKFDKEIKIENMYIKKYCSSYYVKNKPVKVFNDIFYSLNNLFISSINTKKYYNQKLSYIPCLLNKESKALLWIPEGVNTDFSRIEYFCLYLHKNDKTPSFFNIFKIP